MAIRLCAECVSDWLRNDKVTSKWIGTHKKSCVTENYLNVVMVSTELAHCEEMCYFSNGFWVFLELRLTQG